MEETISKFKEMIEFFEGEYHRLRTEFVLENNPTRKYNIEQNIKEALRRKEEAENALKEL